MPFVNVTHLARIKVVDFFPHRLEDFAREVNVGGQIKTRWSFWLTVKDAGDRMTKHLEGEEPQMLNLHVTGAAAEKLLDMKPYK